VLTIEVHPELLQARAELAEVLFLLEGHCSSAASDANKLITMLQRINDGHAPRTLQESARAIVASGDAATSAYSLFRRVFEEYLSPEVITAASTVAETLTGYAQSVLAADLDLWTAVAPSRAK